MSRENGLSYLHPLAVALQVEEVEVLVLEYQPPIEKGPYPMLCAAGGGRSREVRLSVRSFSGDLEHVVCSKDERREVGSPSEDKVDSVSENRRVQVGYRREYLVSLQQLFTEQLLLATGHVVLLWIHKFWKVI